MDLLLEENHRTSANKHTAKRGEAVFFLGTKWKPCCVKLLRARIDQPLTCFSAAGLFLFFLPLLWILKDPPWFVAALTSPRCMWREESVFSSGCVEEGLQRSREGWRSHGRRGRCRGGAVESQSVTQSDADTETDCSSLASETFSHSLEFLLETISLVQRCQLSGLVASFSDYPDPSSNSSKTNEAVFWRGEVVVVVGGGGAVGVLLETFGNSSSSPRAASPAASLSHILVQQCLPHAVRGGGVCSDLAPHWAIIIIQNKKCPTAKINKDGWNCALQKVVHLLFSI